ncbi:MAG: precorrin-6A/cobalt-precorrin-6A reductase [Lachnospiraceae bacterium]|nr:precorrin-6A/cobalt-precorrin-6A reductase [Lachnospiraceae bacterium]
MTDKRRYVNRKCIIFAGTSEGRQLYEFCAAHRIASVFCVATDYGRELLRETGASAEILAGRMDAEEMLSFFRKENPSLIIDATHPYAVEVTANIRKAAERYCREEGIADRVYYRVLRELTEAAERRTGEAADSDSERRTGEAADSDSERRTGEAADSNSERRTGEAADSNSEQREARAAVSYHRDIGQAVSYLQTTEGNILATTGSKQAEELCKLDGFRKRVYLRILPSGEMREKCLALGFLPEHIICEQGPFSIERNEEILRACDIRYLLTKQSGKRGGYPEKEEAARNCGAELVVLVPPQETEGVSVEQMCKIIGKSSGADYHNSDKI